VTESRSRLTVAAEIAGIIGTLVAIITLTVSMVSHGQENPGLSGEGASSQQSPSAVAREPSSPTPMSLSTQSSPALRAPRVTPSSQIPTPISQSPSSYHAPQTGTPQSTYKAIADPNSGKDWGGLAGALIALGFLVFIPTSINLMKRARIPTGARVLIIVVVWYAALLCYNIFDSRTSGALKLFTVFLWFLASVMGFFIWLSLDLRSRS
jgi:hypothetical protein